MKLDRYDRLALAALGLAALVSAAVFAELPESMPIHWNIRGEADGFAPRALGAVLLVGVGAFSWAITRFAARLVPRARRASTAASPLSALAFVMSAFFASMQLVALYAALHPGFTVSGVVSVLFGGLWIALGLILPRVRQNTLVGIRTRATLASPDTWARAHRLGGYLFVASGAASVCAGLVLGRAAIPAMLVCIAVSTIVPAVYAWRLSRTLPPGG